MRESLLPHSWEDRSILLGRRACHHALAKKIDVTMSGMSKFSISLPCFAILAWAVTGCATLFTGTKDLLRINTDSPNTSVYIEGRLVGIAPVSVFVAREGFSTADVKAEIVSADFHCKLRLGRRLNPYAYFNMAFPLFWLVDYGTGALWRFEPRSYFVTRETDGSCSIH